MSKPGYVYILASQKHGTLYVGVTSDLPTRVWQHKDGLVDGFTKKYRVHRLVYYEALDSIEIAIQREKTLKHWTRNWKVHAIEKDNPEWRDLSQDLQL